MTVHCAQCDAVFEPRTPHQRYCSSLCSKRWWSRRYRIGDRVQPTLDDFDPNPGPLAWDEETRHSVQPPLRSDYRLVCGLCSHDRTLKPDYAEMGTERIVGDAPLFTEVAS